MSEKARAGNNFGLFESIECYRRTMACFEWFVHWRNTSLSDLSSILGLTRTSTEDGAAGGSASGVGGGVGGGTDGALGDDSVSSPDGRPSSALNSLSSFLSASSAVKDGELLMLHQLLQSQVMMI